MFSKIYRYVRHTERKLICVQLDNYIRENTHLSYLLFCRAFFTNFCGNWHVVNVVWVYVTVHPSLFSSHQFQSSAVCRQTADILGKLRKRAEKIAIAQNEMAFYGSIAYKMKKTTPNEQLACMQERKPNETHMEFPSDAFKMINSSFRRITVILLLMQMCVCMCAYNKRTKYIFLSLSRIQLNQ